MNRWCQAYALGLANVSRRVFVAPTLYDGMVHDPEAGMPDAWDFWDLPGAAPWARVVRMQPFLARYPLELLDQHWGSGMK
eukprot:CAMPEP_0198601510 /NCGR_PEP_ID=MMETSP1462-20131121/149608_1 /TAXON_ID=1333877 /ORGANISM="Brandtodinium nutriculum, Strain RCC3387" /LENGTH=79 /DNA_ID=CAMNT_0044333243 /DNA_START=286 /DNA_END=522 /DNA_ORIENTATION=-